LKKRDLYGSKIFALSSSNNKTPNEPNTLIGSFSICSSTELAPSDQISITELYMEKEPIDVFGSFGVSFGVLFLNDEINSENTFSMF